MSELKTATVQGKELEATLTEKKQAYIGFLYWYSIGALQVPADAFKAQWDALGIPEKYYPKPIRPLDAFKVATKEMEDKDYLVEDGEKIDDKGIKRRNSRVRLLVSKDQNAAKDALPVIGYWEYNDDKTIKSTVVDQNREQAFNEITKKVTALFDTLCGVYTDKDLRDILRLIVRDMQSISLRPSGAVYFASREHEELLLKMSQLIETISKQYTQSTWGSELTTVPVVDTEAQRKLIYVKFEQDAVGTINDMLPKITDILSDPSRQIIPSQYQEYIETLEYIKECKAKYEELLKFTMDKTAVTMDILQAQLVMLAERVKQR